MRDRSSVISISALQEVGSAWSWWNSVFSSFVVSRVKASGGISDSRGWRISVINDVGGISSLEDEGIPSSGGGVGSARVNLISETLNVWLEVVVSISELSNNGWSPPETELEVISFGERTSNNGVSPVGSQPFVQQSSGGKSGLGDSRVGGFFVPRFNVSSNARISGVGVISSSGEGYSLVVQSSNEVVVGVGGVVGEDEEVIISGGGDGEGPADVTNIVRGSGAIVIVGIRSVPNWGGISGESVVFGGIGMDGVDSVSSEVSGSDDDGVDSLREPFQDGNVRSSSASNCKGSNSSAWIGGIESSVVDLDLGKGDGGLFEEGGDVIESGFSGVDGESLISSGSGSSSASWGQSINVVGSCRWSAKR